MAAPDVSHIARARELIESLGGERRLAVFLEDGTTHCLTQD